jgi:multidrug transporter EmrE-like cation transporter
VKNFLMIVFCVLLGSTAQLSLKHGMGTVGKLPTDVASIPAWFIKAFSNIYVDVGFALYLIASLFWMVILSRVQLSWAYPLVSMGYVIVVVLSRVIFHEPVSLARFAGTLVICAGVILVSRS